MSIDSRLRDGLQRAMSAIDIDAERSLGDARRRGLRRLVIRRTAAIVGVVAAIAILGVAAPGLLDLMLDRGHQPATSPTTAPAQTPTSSISSSPPEAILGTWRSEYTCEALVQAFDRAGVGELAARSLVALGMQLGPVDKLASSPDLCAGAKDIQRTHTFEENGNLLTYQGENLVDDCRCYRLIGGHTFVVFGDLGVDPDMPLDYRIDGETLTFDAVRSDQCSSADCRDQFAFAVGQYMVGPWHHVGS
jgi:hypothetical protein